MRKYKKLQWERVANGFDLICLNPEQLDEIAVREILRKIADKYDDYHNTFSKPGKNLFIEWLESIERTENQIQPLPEAAYCLLSNWFLVSRKNRARMSICAGLALLLWHKLFCAIPEKRLTDPKRNYKVLPEEFALWWTKQLKCQKDC